MIPLAEFNHLLHLFHLNFLTPFYDLTRNICLNQSKLGVTNSYSHLRTSAVPISQTTKSKTSDSISWKSWLSYLQDLHVVELSSSHEPSEPTGANKVHRAFQLHFLDSIIKNFHIKHSNWFQDIGTSELTPEVSSNLEHLDRIELGTKKYNLKIFLYIFNVL